MVQNNQNDIDQTTGLPCRVPESDLRSILTGTPRESSRTIQKLKILKRHHDPVARGQKTCEIRIDDRGYKAWDLIQFSVIENTEVLFVDPQLYEITHVLYFPEALKNNYKALSIRKFHPKI